MTSLQIKNLGEKKKTIYFLLLKKIQRIFFLIQIQRNLEKNF